MVLVLKKNKYSRSSTHNDINHSHDGDVFGLSKMILIRFFCLTDNFCFEIVSTGTITNFILIQFFFFSCSIKNVYWLFKFSV